MTRRAVLGAIVLAIAMASAAQAHRLATGATKRAILRSLTAPGPVNSGHNCTTRALSCWRVVLSGNDWATARDVGPGNNGAAEWLYIDHRSKGRWHYVGGEGEGIIFNCSEKGMPANVAQDLDVVCVVAPPKEETCNSLASIEHGWGSFEKELVPLPTLSSDTLEVGISAEISLGSVGVCSNALTGLSPALELTPPAFALTSRYEGSSGPTSTTFRYSFAPLGWVIPSGTGALDLNPPVTIEWDRSHEAEPGPSLSFTYDPHKPLGVSIQLLSIPIKKETVTLLALARPFLSASVGPELSFEISFERKELAKEKAMDEADGDTADEADQQIADDIESEVDTAVQDEVATIDPAATDDSGLVADAGDASSLVGGVADTTLAADAGPAMDAIVASVDGDAVALGGADAAGVDGAAEVIGGFDFLDVLPFLFFAPDTPGGHLHPGLRAIPHARPLARQPLRASPIHSLSPRSLQRPAFDHRTVAALVHQFLALPVPAKVRPLAVSSTSLIPHGRVSVVATGLGGGRRHFALLVLAGPHYYATRLLRVARHAAGATITLPQHLSQGTWMIAIQDLSSVRSARRHRLRGSANVRLAAFTVPAVAPLRIRAVTFTGSASNPQVTLTGSGFAPEPPASNLAYPGYTGYDYGNNLYLCDTSSHPNQFCAGQNDGSGGGDTIGLVINGYSDSQISYSLGSDYAQSYYPSGTFRLQQGDSFAVHVRGAVCTGVVDFSGRTIACPD